MNPQIYIVVVNYQNWQDTLQCLESVYKSRYDPFQVMVVDNHSPNDSVHRIRDWAAGKLPAGIPADHPLRSLLTPPADKKDLVLVESPLAGVPGDKKTSESPRTGNPLVLITSPRNGGFAFGNNLALKWLLARQCEGIVLLLNPDMLLAPDALSHIARCFSEYGEKTAIGLVVRRFDKPGETAFYGGGRINQWTGSMAYIRDADHSARLQYISGGCLAVRLKDYQAVGLLPEEYFLYWEDLEWCEKFKKHGGRLAVCSSALAYDKGGTSIDRKSFRGYHHFTLGGLIFFARHFPRRVKYVVFFNVFRAVKQALALRREPARAIISAITAFRSRNR